ncbi:lipopolysaccharide biosynthesis protein [Mycobacterium sp. C3-094]
MTSVRTLPSRGLVGNSVALLATTHATAVLGYVFWMLCARGFTPGVIGVTNTVISAMTFVSIVTVSGFVPMLTRLLPGASDEERSGLFSTALLITAVSSGLVGAAVAPFMPERLKAVIGTGWLIGFLSVGAMVTALLLVINAALLGVRRAELSLVGAVVGSIARLAAVAVTLSLGVLAVGIDGPASHSILLIWITSLALSIVLSLWLLARATTEFRFRPRLAWLSRMRHSLGWDHLATLAVRSPALLIPVIAAAYLPPEKIGYLAVVLLIGSAFLAVAAAVSNSLLADCADGPDRIRAQARRAWRLIATLLFVPVVITCLLAKEVLGFFGPEYTHYSPLLILLLFSTFPDAVINVGIAVLRVQGEFPKVATVTAAGAVMSVGGAWVAMPYFGMFGAVLAVLFSQSVVATMFAVFGLRRTGPERRGVR